MGIERVMIIWVIIVSSLISMASAIAGYSTFYTPPYLPSACYGLEDQGKMIAAANRGLFNNKVACGRFYRVVCTGGTNISVNPACRDGVVRVKIVDLCPGCDADQIDLSTEAFSIIANPTAGRIRMDYVTIDCNGATCDNADSAPEQAQDMPSPPPLTTPPTQIGDGVPPVQTAPGSDNRQNEEGSNAGRSPVKKIVIVLPLCITGVVIASIIMFFFIKRRRSAKGKVNQDNNQYVENFLLQHGSLAPKRYKYSQLKKITESFTDKLGKGGYGSVYKGTLPDGSLVAVKVLMETDSNGEEFINEVASISRTSHVNIVTLLGFCYEGSKRALIYEYMPNKSLDKFLSNNGGTLDLQKLFEISVGIAKGLEYLHTGCNTRIVHFDIKPQNILLDEDLCPKISDFGLAKLCKKKQSVLSVMGTRGTIGYIAPEVFSRNFGGVSHKSDVYSYGMMVLEMVGAKNVVETNEVVPSSESYFPDKIYEEVILDVTNKVDDSMIDQEEETRRKMFLIGFWCIQTIPTDRPSMSKVGEMLEGSVHSIQIPPKPYLFTQNLPHQQFSSTFSAHVDTQISAQH